MLAFVRRPGSPLAASHQGWSHANTLLAKWWAKEPGSGGARLRSCLERVSFSCVIPIVRELVEQGAKLIGCRRYDDVDVVRSWGVPCAELA